MYNIRVSVPEDVPAERLLWKLAFGDDGAYVDNFYDTYYRPDRFLVLEVDGTVRAMTAWFDTSLILPGKEPLRAAYLYAVATHPDFRSQGLARDLLQWADGHFASLGFPVVTTVPAEPGLHCFFGANGFRECFILEESRIPAPAAPEGEPVLQPVGPTEYNELRESLLADIPHIFYPEDAIRYQAGCCRVLSGGLFRAEFPEYGPAAICAEDAGDGTLFLKEVLGSPEARRAALRDLPRLLPAQTWVVRGPKGCGNAPVRFFGMVKMTDPELQKTWDWTSTAYLGLAFD